ncbi:MAG: hypothetical protein MRJ93_12065 [Nitrososphaeraceae archaeon]|nr:hypothetical protein [Nitrososphaeraceae archaeon]
MNFITRPIDNPSYINVETNRYGYPKEQTEQEKREYKKLFGQQLKISDKTFQLLNDIEPYTTIQYKGKSCDNAMSKVLRYYIDSHSGHNNSLEQIRQVNKEKIDKIRPTIPRQDPHNYDYRIGYPNTIHCEQDTYAMLEQISRNYFSTNPDNYYMSGFFGGTEDCVLQVVLEYYLDNNPDKKQSKK